MSLLLLSTVHVIGLAKVLTLGAVIYFRFIKHAHFLRNQLLGSLAEQGLHASLVLNLPLWPLVIRIKFRISCLHWDLRLLGLHIQAVLVWVLRPGSSLPWSLVELGIVKDPWLDIEECVAKILSHFLSGSALLRWSLVSYQHTHLLLVTVLGLCWDEVVSSGCRLGICCVWRLRIHLGIQGGFEVLDLWFLVLVIVA